jgi:hypothetical protein
MKTCNIEDEIDDLGADSEDDDSDDPIDFVYAYYQERKPNNDRPGPSGGSAAANAI